MIRCVIFDLGQVIVPFEIERGYRAFAQVCPHSPEELRCRVLSTGLVPRFERGEIEPRDFVERICSALDLKVTYDEFCRLWSSIFLPETLVPEALVAGIRSRRRTLLLSNTNAIHFEMIRENYPIIRHFDGCILSHEVKAMKPAPEIYRAAIASAGCRPEEIFFIDDIAEYVEAARREGIDAVQFQSREQLEQELSARGIDW